MPVRIRLSRGGAKKRPFYRIVVADSRRALDGKFIERIGTYNPMLLKDNPDRVKIDIERAKHWLSQGALPSDRIVIFLSNMGVLDKPKITEKTARHLPKKERRKQKEKAKPSEEAKKDEAKGDAPEEKAKPSEEAKKDEAKVDAPEEKAKPSEEAKKENVEKK